MSTWLLETEYAVAFFVLLVPLLMGPWISRQFTKYGRLSGWPAVLSVGTVAYVCALVAFTMFPLPRLDAEVCSAREVADHLRLMPFQSFGSAWAELGQVGPMRMLTSFSTLQIAFNVLFFVPLGFLLGHRWRRGLAATMAIGLGVSLLIESTQGTAVWGLFPCPYRVAEADDLITNTTGALLGWLVAWALRDRLPDPNPARIADLGMPGLLRRSAAVFIDLLVLFELILASQLVIELIGIRLPGGTSTSIILTEILVILLLVVVVPSRRSDQGTPGTSSVHLAVAASDGSPAPARGLLVRAAIRYLPLALFGLPWAVFGIVDLLVASRRHDRRTLTDMVAGTVVLTRSVMAAERDDEDHP